MIRSEAHRAPQAHPASTTGKWMAGLAEKGNQLSNVQRIFFNKLPYAVLQSTIPHLDLKWTEWQHFANTLAQKKVTDANEFISAISNQNSQVRLFHFLETAQKLDHAAIRDCFKNCMNFEHLRANADEDLSNGYMRDISPQDLQSIALKMCTYNNWRLMGDAFGFDNLACRRFATPLEVLKQWLAQYPNASVKRLEFEANLLAMPNVCSYLKAIPLDLERIEAPFLSEHDLNFRRVTKFDINKFKELLNKEKVGVDWGVVAKALCPHENINPMPLDPSDLIWMSLSVQVSYFIDTFDDTPTLSKIKKAFKEDLAAGIYEPTSAGGVTYHQMQLLAESVQTFMSIRRGPPINQEDRLIDLNRLETKELPFLNRRIKLCLKDFLFLWWQHSSSSTQDMHALVESFIEIFSRNEGSHAKEFARILKEQYEKKRPYRKYDQHLADLNEAEKKANAEKPKADMIPSEALPKSVEKPQELKEAKEAKAKETADKVSKLADVVGKVECGVCMDKPINAVFIPCGHLQYCLNCIKDSVKCPTCSERGIAYKVYLPAGGAP